MIRVVFLLLSFFQGTHQGKQTIQEEKDKKEMSQQQRQQQLAQSNGVDIDYLAINRARWDERAPHVSFAFLLHACIHKLFAATTTTALAFVCFVAS